MNINRLVVVLFVGLMCGCTSNLEQRAPAWFLPSADTEVSGVSVVVNPFHMPPDGTRTITNGLRIDPLGLGFLLPLAGAPYAHGESQEEFEEYLKSEAIELVRGLNLSLTGSAIRGNVYGVSLGGIATVTNEVRGFSGAFYMNMTRKTSGVQVAFGNHSHQVNGLLLGVLGSQTAEINGLQVGLINFADSGHGIQIGLWNRNSKRSLPLINWVWDEADSSKTEQANQAP